jgi:hypothetical protein
LSGGLAEEERLRRLDQGVAGEPQQGIAAGRDHLDRGQGDRGGEGVGDDQIVLEVIDPVAAGHAQRGVRRRHQERRRRREPGGGGRGLLSGKGDRRREHEGKRPQSEQGDPSKRGHVAPP